MSERDAEMFRLQQLRAMEHPSWSEGRLDDLNRKVDAGIGRLDDERKEFRGEMRKGFDKVDEEFKSVRSEMKDEFKSVRTEMKSGFDRMQWTLLVVASGIIAALITAPHL
jgi:hypothetical protein